MNRYSVVRYALQGIAVAVALYYFLAYSSGCAGEVTSEGDAHALSIAVTQMDAFAAYESVDVDGCRGDLGRFRFVAAEVERVPGLCAWNQPLWACFYFEHDGTPVMVYDIELQGLERDRVMRHEFNHWLLECTWVDRSGDPDHLRPELWRADRLFNHCGATLASTDLPDDECL